MNLFDKVKKSWSSAGRRCKRGRSSAQLGLEILEARKLFVVGAVAMPEVVEPGTGYDGVVQITSPEGSCTGALLETGRHVLTSANCLGFDHHLRGKHEAYSVEIELADSDIHFDVKGDDIRISKDFHCIIICEFPSWDLAVMTLPELAPSGPGGADRYEFFHSAEEQEEGHPVRRFQVVGYGVGGSVSEQVQEPAGVKRVGENDFGFIGRRSMTSDFDNPNAVPMYGAGFNNIEYPDALGDGRGLGENETSAAEGDEGAPAFVDGRIKGVFLTNPAAEFNSVSQYVRVSRYAAWINETLASPDYDLVLDMNNQPAGNDGQIDTIVVKETDGRTVIEVNEVEYYSDQADSINSITIIGSADNDRISAPANRDVTIKALGGMDGLSISEPVPEEVAWNVTRHRGGTVGGIDFYGIEYVGRTASNDDIGKERRDMKSAAGVQGRDSFTVKNGGSLQFAFGGNDTDNFFIHDGGSIDEVHGGNVVGEVGGNDALTIRSNGGETTFSVDAIQRGSISNGTTFTGINRLRGGKASDRFIIKEDGWVQSVQGLRGRNSLEVHGNANGSTAWTVDNFNQGAVTVGEAKPTLFFDIADLTGGNFVDEFHVTVGHDANGHETRGAASRIVGGGSRDMLTVDANPQNFWTIPANDQGTITDKNGSSIDFFEVERLVGGNGVDDFLFENASRLSLNGGIDGKGGDDTLRILDAAGHWIIDGPNQGWVRDAKPDDGAAEKFMHFDQIENLVAGQYVDYFYPGIEVESQCGGVGTISGSIDGGDDNESGDWLDYSSNCHQGVDVDLHAGFATGVAGLEEGRVRNIENVRGTEFVDQIWGNGIANQLYGLGGGDFLYGLAGADYIDGGEGQDYLDGGFDSDRDELRGGRGERDAFFDNMGRLVDDEILDFEEGLDVIWRDMDWITDEDFDLSPDEPDFGDAAGNGFGPPFIG